MSLITNIRFMLWLEKLYFNGDVFYIIIIFVRPHVYGIDGAHENILADLQAFVPVID